MVNAATPEYSHAGKKKTPEKRKKKDLLYFATLGSDLPSCHVYVIQNDVQERSANLQLVWQILRNLSLCVQYPAHTINGGVSSSDTRSAGRRPR